MADRLEQSSDAHSMHSTEQQEKKDDLATSAPSEDVEYPPFKRVLAIVLGMMSVSLLVALDRTIIATAIPAITDHFNSLDDVGWYASSYLLTMSAFQLLIGRIYTFYSTKWVYITSIGIFELGSLVCGAAPSSVAFIIGRSIAGIGSAGIFAGAIVVIVDLVPLEKRPAWTGAFGAVFAIASVAGPLLGGVFTTNVSWRWCFYINLPIGGAAMAILAFILKVPARTTKRATLKEQIHQLDPIGTAIFIPSITCLLLALQWGGIDYAWSDGRIIALLVLAGVLFIAFIGVQMWRQELATVPPRIIKMRAVAAGMTYSFFSGAGMITIVYFLPIWFQAIKGATAVHSGIMNLPAVLGITLASIVAGIGTRKLGYFTHWMVVSSVMTSVGVGLMCTFTLTTGHSKWIGYQALWGIGLGLGMQQPSVAAQTVLARKDVPTGATIMFFAQGLGGSVCVSIANNIFLNKLSTGLTSIPGINGDLVTHVGATDLRNVVPAASLDAVLAVYNLALRNAFYVGVAVSTATIIGTLLMPWINIKKVAADQKAAAALASTPKTAGSAEQQQETEAKRVEEV
ncbi:hypothetical protein LTR84_008179 [Exophiala bonariae]|uniref:Major facilitator superfamily (MFS) profile domain-containing protein n=1 Tax=Exophiala bonariae TaxID=1690606 RepID=A0AAV9N152_9EURO|nr:hypothetical protein LTR84_008179 [Exophiala bonariae]